MLQKFKVWSEISTEGKSQLAPTFELRGWQDLTPEEKGLILKHLRSLKWFTDYSDIERMTLCINRLNHAYRAKSYGTALLEQGGVQYEYHESLTQDSRKAGVSDFVRILKNEDSHVVLELLSYFAQSSIKKYYLKENASEQDIAAAFDEFDSFANAINNIFGQFGVNLILTREGFLPKQEEIVQELVVDPVLKALAGKEWEPVRAELRDAISEYHKAEPTSYSNSITHLVSALQAYLQIKVGGKLGQGDIDALIREGISRGKLPNDGLSKKVLNGLKSVLMEYRQKQGDAHPKNEYANEKSARLVLNLVAVFIQHTF